MQMRTISRIERLSWLDILKGIGIIFVVVGHIYSNSTIFNWLYSFHIPLFFLAAGWVYKEKPIFMDLKRRIQTIVVPYFLFGLLVLVYWQFIERRFRDSDMSFGNAVLGLLSGQYDYLEFNIHLWFLPCFFVVVVTFNVLVNIGGKKVAYVVSALMSVIFALASLPGVFWGIDRVFKYIGFYAVGCYLSDRNLSKYVGEQMKLVQGLVAIGLLIFNFVLAYFSLTIGAMWFVTAVIGVFGMTMVSMLINKSRILQYFGRISLIILCIHGPIYRIVVKLISVLVHMSTDALRNNFVLVIVVVVITMVVCSFAYEVTVRIAPWVIGEKKKIKFIC